MSSQSPGPGRLTTSSSTGTPSCPRRRGRHAGGPAIRPDRLTEVLLHLAEFEDESAISMRRVATELGVSAKLLYLYVSGRAELMSLLADAISARFVILPTDAPWKERLTTIAWSTWRVIARYPGISPHTLLDVTRFRSSRNALRMVDTIKRALHDAGLSGRAADRAHLSLAAHLLG